MCRFVILRHDHPFLHWDLLLEEESSLRAWRLLNEPITTEPIRAEPLAAHRKLYLDYEGPLSENRGSVTQWDAGTMEWIECTPEIVIVRLVGDRVRSEVRLSHSSDSQEWLFQLMEFET